MNGVNFEKLVTLVWQNIAKTFAIGKSIAVKIIHNFCDEIVRIFPNFIKFPQNQKETATAMEFFKRHCSCKIPQSVGA